MRYFGESLLPLPLEHGEAAVAERDPRVSVLMIFLDAERFIEEAIASVFAQRFDDWELLLIDDGSRDGSSAIARTCAEQHPERVRYLEHPGHLNRGMSASRNLGVSHARGEYIALLDADDVYLPDKLSDQVALLDAHPEAAMLYGRTRLWFSWDGGADAPEDALTAAAPRLNARFDPPELLSLYLRHETYYPCTCGILVRRRAVVSVHGFEEEFRGTYEDMAFYAKLFLRFPVYVADGCWDLYRQHAGQSWAAATASGDYVEGGAGPARLAFLRWLRRHLRSSDVNAPEISGIVRRKLLYHTFARLLRGSGKSGRVSRGTRPSS